MPTLTGDLSRLLKINDRDRIALSVWWRSIFPHTGFREHQRVPLWHPDVPFVLITSQRAGSTMGATWFFHHAGLLEKARAYDPFAHRYEQDIFLKANGYFAGLKRAVREKPAVKLVRDPGARAFSSYLALHDARATADPRDHRTSIRRKIAQQANKPFTADMRLSFSEFLAWAAQVDHRRIDGHEARQKNLYEDSLPRGIEHIIKLEGAEADIPGVEKALGLVPSTPEQIIDLGTSQHYVKKIDAEAPTIDEIMNEGVTMPRPGRQPKITTQTIAAYPEAHRDLILAFGPDYEAYGYDAHK